MNRAGSTLAIVFCCAALLAACAAPGPPAPTMIDAAAEGLKAFDRGDWAAAAPLLREALARDAGSLRLHYSLAVADSYLDAREEAIREFSWVLDNAAPSSSEAETARAWLTAAGILRDKQANTRRDDAPADVQDARPVDARDTVPRAGVAGRVVWDDAEAPVNVSRLQLFLKGLEGTSTQDAYHVVRTDEEGNFQFKNIAPGGYKLINRVAGKPDWRLRVELGAGQQAALDLTPRNSTRVRDDFSHDP